jgi:hypothetical protein
VGVPREGVAPKCAALCARAKTGLWKTSIVPRGLIVVEVGVAVNLRRRFCYVLSLLKIRRPNCKHCAACLTCGTELRERLQELNGPTRLGSPMQEGIMG